LVETNRRPGGVPVYGTNGQCGNHDSALFRGPGVILGRKGQGPLGVEWCPSDYWVIDTAYSLAPLRDDIDLRYAYYLIKFVGLNHLKDGTSNPTLSRDSFGSQAFPLPPLAEQRRIADMLAAFDDKIELNRRMSQTLESMARALFKSWFVNFDPVRAQAEGTCAGLSTRLASFFPDSFEDSRLGALPSGWRASTVGDEFRVVMGQSPPGETYNSDGVGAPFYQGRADFGDRFPSRRVYCTAPTRHASAGDTLVCVRAPVGDTNQASEDCAIGRGLAAVRHRSGAISYTYLAMRNLRDSFAAYEAGGTVFGAIGKDQFRDLPVIAPAAGAVVAFEEVAGSLDGKVARAQAQVSSLIEARDALLPLLLSGQRMAADSKPKGVDP